VLTIPHIDRDDKLKSLARAPIDRCDGAVGQRARSAWGVVALPRLCGAAAGDAHKKRRLEKRKAGRYPSAGVLCVGRLVQL